MSKEVHIRNQSQPGGAAVRAHFCDTFLCRLRGLTFRRSLPAGEGLLLVQARDSVIDSSIHMLFMRMDLAVVWINSALRVVDVKHARRWRLVYLSRAPARYVLETSLENLDTFKIGDCCAFDEILAE
jgi:uncharacterized membrane protein (UPF0127 family)